MGNAPAASATPASAETLLAVIEEATRRCRRVKISSASSFLRQAAWGGDSSLALQTLEVPQFFCHENGHTPVNKG